MRWGVAECAAIEHRRLATVGVALFDAPRRSAIGTGSAMSVDCRATGAEAIRVALAGAALCMGVPLRGPEQQASGPPADLPKLVRRPLHQFVGIAVGD